MNAETGEQSLVLVEKSVGQVSQEGDSWNAENMNDMEGRVANAFDEAKKYTDDTCKTTLNQANNFTNQVGNNMYTNARQYTDTVKNALLNQDVSDRNLSRKLSSWEGIGVAPISVSASEIRYSTSEIARQFVDDEGTNLYGYDEFLIEISLPGNYTEAIISRNFLNTNNAVMHIKVSDSAEVKIRKDTGYNLYIEAIGTTLQGTYISGKGAKKV